MHLKGLVTHFHKMALHHIFLESRNPEVTKNLYYVLSLEGIQKKVLLADYIIYSKENSDFFNKQFQLRAFNYLFLIFQVIFFSSKVERLRSDTV